MNVSIQVFVNHVLNMAGNPLGVTLLLSIDYTDLLRKEVASDSLFNTLTSVYCRMHVVSPSAQFCKVNMQMKNTATLEKNEKYRFRFAVDSA